MEAIVSPSTKVDPKPERRAFSAAYKLCLLDAVDACQPGEVGALLRREGLYSSHLTTWRKQREQGALNGLAPKRRGRKADPHATERAQLHRRIVQLETELEKAHTVIDVQKKLSTLLSVPLAAATTDEETTARPAPKYWRGS